MIVQNSKIFKVSFGKQKFFGFVKFAIIAVYKSEVIDRPYTIYGISKKSRIIFNSASIDFCLLL
jgi:hypothetical protein